MLEQLNQPSWEPVDRAQPIVLAAPKKVVPKKSKHQVHIALPDPQIGYRNLDSGFDPFHDEHAMDVALQITSYLEETDRLDTVINLGDFLDLPAQGRFEQEAAMANTTQAAFDRGHLFLQQQRLAAGPKAKIVLINTEFYNSLNVGNIVKKIDEDKLDWNILEYNVLNKGGN